MSNSLRVGLEISKNETLQPNEQTQCAAIRAYTISGFALRAKNICAGLSGRETYGTRFVCPRQSVFETA